MVSSQEWGLLPDRVSHIFPISGIRFAASFPCDPFADRNRTYFFEVPFKCWQAPPCKSSDFFYCQLPHVIFIQKIQDVDLPRMCKIEKYRIKSVVELQESVCSCKQLQLHDFLGRDKWSVEKREKGDWEAFYGGSFREFYDTRFISASIFGKLISIDRCVQTTEHRFTKVHENAAEGFFCERPLVHIDSVFSADKGAFPFVYTNSLAVLFNSQLARIRYRLGYVPCTYEYMRSPPGSSNCKIYRHN